MLSFTFPKNTRNTSERVRCSCVYQIQTGVKSLFRPLNLKFAKACTTLMIKSFMLFQHLLTKTRWKLSMKITTQSRLPQPDYRKKLKTLTCKLTCMVTRIYSFKIHQASQKELNRPHLTTVMRQKVRSMI